MPDAAGALGLAAEAFLPVAADAAEAAADAAAAERIDAALPIGVSTST